MCTHCSVNAAVRFNTDSAPIGVDNRCTACISHAIEDFEGPLEECNRAIKGFGGTRTEGVQIGTLKWKWLDDDGKTHTFLIPKSYYVPQGKVRLLSGNEVCDKSRKKGGKQRITTLDGYVIPYRFATVYQISIWFLPLTMILISIRISS